MHALLKIEEDLKVFGPQRTSFAHYWACITTTYGLRRAARARSGSRPPSQPIVKIKPVLVKIAI